MCFRARSRDKRTIAAGKLFDEDAEAAIRMAIDPAMEAGRAEKEDEKMRRRSTRNAQGASWRFPVDSLYVACSIRDGPC